jgi:hypothetical protein
MVKQKNIQKFWALSLGESFVKMWYEEKEIFMDTKPYTEESVFIV